MENKQSFSEKIYDMLNKKYYENDEEFEMEYQLFQKEYDNWSKEYYTY